MEEFMFPVLALGIKGEICGRMIPGRGAHAETSLGVTSTLPSVWCTRSRAKAPEPRLRLRVPTLLKYPWTKN